MFNVQTSNCMQYNSEQVITEGVITTRSNRMKFRLDGGVKCEWFIYLFIYLFIVALIRVLWRPHLQMFGGRKHAKITSASNVEWRCPSYEML